jgi:hypothetical protein
MRERLIKPSQRLSGVWPALDSSPLESEPARLPTFPVERGGDAVALDHHYDFASRIPQSVALEEEAHLLLHPPDLLASADLAATQPQDPNIGVIVLAFDLADFKASPRQVLGELDMEEHRAHAAL